MKLCEENCLHYINNNNITIRHLFKDGLHLLESGKCTLANNFIDSLNHFLLRQPRRGGFKVQQLQQVLKLKL